MGAATAAAVATPFEKTRSFTTRFFFFLRCIRVWKTPGNIERGVCCLILCPFEKPGSESCFSLFVLGSRRFCRSCRFCRFPLTCHTCASSAGQFWRTQTHTHTHRHTQTHAHKHTKPHTATQGTANSAVKGVCSVSLGRSKGTQIVNGRGHSYPPLPELVWSLGSERGNSSLSPVQTHQRHPPPSEFSVGPCRGSHGAHVGNLPFHSAAGAATANPLGLVYHVRPSYMQALFLWPTRPK